MQDVAFFALQLDVWVTIVPLVENNTAINMFIFKKPKVVFYLHVVRQVILFVLQYAVVKDQLILEVSVSYTTWYYISDLPGLPDPYCA
jgi:hypothetical protein